MHEPRITIIIPTRERCDVLESSLRTAISQEYENLEIIVSDNFSDDDTANVVQRANDRRIRYVNPGKRLSMSHNWEFALSHVADGWVTVMGDDDGLLPGAISSVVDTIRMTQAEAIRSNFCTYDWPGVSNNDHGQLIVPLSKGLEMRKTHLWLSKVMQGRAKYNQLPMIYNGGFIHISILKKIKELTGMFFRSANPDIFSAVAIARSVESYAYIRKPLAISGTSKHSNGHSNFSTRSKRNESPGKQFASEDNPPFHPSIPLCTDGSIPLSLQACVYEAYMQSEILGGQVGAVSPAQQLNVILAKAGEHRSSLLEWGGEFAKMHDIVFSDVLSSSKHQHLQLVEWIQKLFSAANSVIVDTLPITNVHEASIAAAVIRLAPGRIDTLRFLAQRTVHLTRRRGLHFD